MSKAVFVKDLVNHLGENLSEAFAVAAITRRATKTGKPFKSLVLRDKTGSVSGIVWEDFLPKLGQIKVGDIAQFNFTVEEFRGTPSLKITHAQPLETYEPADFVALARRDLAKMEQELAKRIDSVRDYQLRKLLDAFFDDKEFYQQFITAPAAKLVHHAYRHGLLEHTLEVLAFLDPLLGLYPQVNRDLVIAAILLHDIGKIKEYQVSTNGDIKRSVTGRLLGHIYLSAQMIEQRLPEDFSAEIKRQLLHIVLSHQGKLEYGSPVLPATLEAIAVFHADHLSSELNIAQGEIEQAIQNAADGQPRLLFSEYNKYLGTQVFVGGEENE